VIHGNDSNLIKCNLFSGHLSGNRAIFIQVKLSCLAFRKKLHSDCQFVRTKALYNNFDFDEALHELFPEVSQTVLKNRLWCIFNQEPCGPKSSTPAMTEPRRTQKYMKKQKGINFQMTI